MKCYITIRYEVFILKCDYLGPFFVLRAMFGMNLWFKSESESESEYLDSDSNSDK